ncbi:MAG: hypothetical protein ACLGIR_13110 [Actinomycetes bacterium]
MRDDDPTDPTERPDFGPSGYLPERASKRARKIVLRAPLGLQWLVAAVLAGVVVLVAGVLFLRSAGAPPGPPFELVPGGLTAAAPVTVGSVGGRDVAIVTAGGTVRVFDVEGLDGGLVYCEGSNRLTDGTDVWLVTGRGTAGARSLSTLPSVAVDGELYADPTRTLPGPEPTDEPGTCA